MKAEQQQRMQWKQARWLSISVGCVVSENESGGSCCVYATKSVNEAAINKDYFFFLLFASRFVAIQGVAMSVAIAK